MTLRMKRFLPLNQLSLICLVFGVLPAVAQSPRAPQVKVVRGNNAFNSLS